MIALGTTAGKVVVLNSYNGIQLTTLLVGGAQVNALSFSPGVPELHYQADITSPQQDNLKLFFSIAPNDILLRFYGFANVAIHDLRNI